MKNIKAITFDFWGTLFSSAKSNNSARLKIVQKALIQAGLPPVLDSEMQTAVKTTWGEWVKVWETEYRTLGACEWLSTMEKLLNFQIPQNERNQLLNELEEVVLDGNTQPINGVAKMIPLLAKDYRLGIISDTGISSGKTLSKLLEREGLLSFFSSLVFSDEVGSSKPAILPFQTALSDLHVLPQQAVHVGDLRRTDVAGANNSGMWSIRFTGFQDDLRIEFGEASIVLADYAEMPAALEQIELFAGKKGLA